MRIVMYDKDIKGAMFLKFYLRIGAFIGKILGVYDRIYGISTWEEFFEIINTEKDVKQVDYWGHGSSGEVYLQNTPLTLHLNLNKDAKLNVETIWFRTCSTLRGKSGLLFLEKVIGRLGKNVGGFTEIIWFFQSGCYLVDKVPSKHLEPEKKKVSSPTHKRTLLAINFWRRVEDFRYTEK